MSTIIEAFIVIACTIGIPLLIYSVSKQRRKTRNLKRLDLFINKGSGHGLSFSKKELLKDKIIGLDEMNKALMVFEFANADDGIIISLPDVKQCTTTKEYSTVNMGDAKRIQMEQHLNSVGLKFDFTNGSHSLSVPFYDITVNSIYEMAELEAKAKEWETVLTKMIPKLNSTRA